MAAHPGGHCSVQDKEFLVPDGSIFVKSALTPLTTYLEAMLVSVDNQSCSGLADGFDSESISHDWFQRTLKDSKVCSLHKDLVNKLGLEGDTCS